MPDNEDITDAPAPERPDDEGDSRRRRREREDDDPYRRERDVSFRKRSWLEKELINTNIVILVLFGLCCGGIAAITGLIGVLTCQEPEARQKATILLVIGGCMMAVGIGFQVLSAAARH